MLQHACTSDFEQFAAPKPPGAPAAVLFLQWLVHDAGVNTASAVARAMHACMSDGRVPRLRQRWSAVQRDDSAALRWELEEKCSKVGTLEERLRGAQAQLDSRSHALAEAQTSLQRSRAEVAELRCRLAAPPAPDAVAPDDAEVAGLQAEITRLNAALQDRRSGSGSAKGGFAAGLSGDSDLELVQLRCLLDAKERELAGVRGELVAAQATALASAAQPQRDGAAEVLRAQVEEVTEQRRAAERRAAEAEGAHVLLDAECAALRADVQRLQAIVEDPAQVRSSMHAYVVGAPGSGPIHGRQCWAPS